MQLNQTHVCEENKGGEAAEISERTIGLYLKEGKLPIAVCCDGAAQGTQTQIQLVFHPAERKSQFLISCSD